MLQSLLPLGPSGYKPSGISEKGKFGDLVKAIAGVSVSSNSKEARGREKKAIARGEPLLLV